MRNEKELLKQWKADLRAAKEEKQKKKREKKKSKRFNIPGNTTDFMNRKHIYYKRNGVWKQREN
ncbi:hypothetical protein COD78_31740 [Bacillus cereus]|uniref:hypothetical protein n=1 Tax=Bacillus cereus TaxID=1396 RepID=UPI000BF907A6|nr:hypothetical protein [Bacillus cereus]PEX03441.1 hypothetical protein CN454_31925 [Bacillus cereus]PGV16801.1 hypothetical protein COD78_31740 [Bacillus cereus]